MKILIFEELDPPAEYSYERLVRIKGLSPLP